MDFSKLVWKSFRKFLKDDLLTLSAALAFYTILFIVPFFALVLIFSSVFLDEMQVINSLLIVIKSFTGLQVSSILEAVLTNKILLGKSSSSIFNFVILLIGATAFVGPLQKGVNNAFNSARSSKKIILPSQKLKALFTIFGGTILFLIFLALSSTMNYFIRNFGDFLLPLNYLIWFLFLFTIFLFIFRYLPDKRKELKQTYPGALFTAVFFLLGQIFLNIYLAFSRVGSVFGTFSSIIIFIVWVYYSSAVFFLGAEFTYLRSRTIH